MLEQLGSSELLPTLAPVLEGSSSEPAQGSPCGLRCGQISRVTQLSVRLSPGVTQGRFRSTSEHCRLTNLKFPHFCGSAWVQMAGSGPAGLEVQNDNLRIHKGSQVPPWVRAFPAPM